MLCSKTNLSWKPVASLGLAVLICKIGVKAYRMGELVNVKKDNKEFSMEPGRSLLSLSRSSHVRLCVTPWTAAHQAPPSIGFSRQAYWSGVPFPSPYLL